MHRISGTAVFLTGSKEGVPPALLHNLKHNKVLHEYNPADSPKGHKPKCTRSRPGGNPTHNQQALPTALTERMLRRIDLLVS
jgi:hypothetical protein